VNTGPGALTIPADSTREMTRMCKLLPSWLRWKRKPPEQEARHRPAQRGLQPPRHVGNLPDRWQAGELDEDKPQT
jgi:hypothetical protein